MIDGPCGKQAGGAQEENSDQFDGDDIGISPGPPTVCSRVLTPEEPHEGGRGTRSGTQCEEHVAKFDGEMRDGVEHKP